MLKKFLLAIASCLIIQANISAQNKKQDEQVNCNMQIPSPKCDQPKQPKGAYYQTIENYAPVTGHDSLVRVLSSETSMILSFKKNKVTLLARQCSPGCTYPNPFKYLYEKKGNWNMRNDTVTIIWQYQKDSVSTKWQRLAKTDPFKLKYERNYKTNYPVIDCKSALIPNNKNPFTGYGN